MLHPSYAARFAEGKAVAGLAFPCDRWQKIAHPNERQAIMSPVSENLLLQHREVTAVIVSSGLFFGAMIFTTWLIA
jgi:hypothetical protein